MSRYRCDCGDSECPSCGTAQGTRRETPAEADQTRRREAERLTLQEDLGLNEEILGWMLEVGLL